jgi:hypothetical protein
LNRHSFPFVRRSILCTTALLIVLFVFADTTLAQPADSASTTAAAVQEPTDPNPGALSLSGGFDFQSTYMFRGIRQHSTGVAAWPWADLAIAAYAGEGTLKSVNLNVGSWNSQHTGDTGNDGPSGKLWYESDFYATLGFGFGGGVSLATTYTAYTSPNNSFTSVKEIMVKMALDDSAYLGKGAIKPYVALARELDAAEGVGQADGGLKAGTYFEAGIAPGLSFSKASIAVPVKVGLSLSDYYEVAGVDNRFGFLSVAGIVTVPLGSTTKYGSWNLHGGAEFQKVGDNTAILNGGKRSRVMGSIGVGFSY